MIRLNKQNPASVPTPPTDTAWLFWDDVPKMKDSTGTTTPLSPQIVGTATLVGGTVVVAETAVEAGSVIILTGQADGGTPGFLRVTARTPGTDFTITSSDPTDTSTVGYAIYN